MKIVLTGGGTGGHVIPHLSLLPLIKKDFKNIHYIGRKSGIEQQIISQHREINYHSIPAAKFVRDNILKNLLLPFTLIKSICSAKKILKQINPDVIFSKGGFVSLPVVIAGHKLKIPVVSHESDLSMGMANKIIYKHCNCMCTTFEKTAEGKDKCAVTGSPIRTQLYNGNKQKVIETYNLDPNKKTLLFMGGSTGALVINNALYKVLPVLIKTYNIIHIVGKNKGDNNIKFNNYCQLEFSDKIEDIYAASDYIISRAGSNAVCEFLALKKPMLLIPLQNNASRGDQVENAELFKKLGYANVLKQTEINPIKLLDEVSLLIKSGKQLISNMTNAKNINGCKNIYEQILKHAKKEG